MRIFRPGSLVLAGLLGCSSAGSGAPAPSTPPSPVILQYVGEYDGDAASVTLHVDGTFDALVAGRRVSGTYSGISGRPDADLRATLEATHGTSSLATFHTTAGASGGPPQSAVELSGALLTARLLAPWVASNEAMCDGTGGTWTDDDPDPATRLYCRCAAGELYLPSRGGCVARRDGGDPPRVAVSSHDGEALGHYAGMGTITEVSLAADGSYRATRNGEADAGTWWDAGAPGSFAMASAHQAFWATYASRVLTLDLGDHVETLRKDR